MVASLDSICILLLLPLGRPLDTTGLEILRPSSYPLLHLRLIRDIINCDKARMLFEAVTSEACSRTLKVYTIQFFSSIETSKSSPSAAIDSSAATSYPTNAVSFIY